MIYDIGVALIYVGFSAVAIWFIIYTILVFSYKGERSDLFDRRRRILNKFGYVIFSAIVLGMILLILSFQL